MDICRWIYRPGAYESHWARTDCSKYMNYLSKVPACEPYVGVADYYNNKKCPLCGKAIKMDYRLIERLV